ncbi:MAG: hypothetical protein GY941_30235, partial [Planctomycetes bacterium]|nr:hypothetical protein [Planctomycetota bacterium]
AVIYAAEKWSHLLRYKEYQIHTDHKNLQQLLNKSRDFKTGKLFRWAVRLQDHQFKCTYIRGKDNVVADYLSRDSVMIQHPQYELVKDFYAANPNPIRKWLSNTEGVDIHALYMRHLDIERLNRGSNGHYFPSHRDPYKLLVQNSGLSHLSRPELRHLLAKTDHYLLLYENESALPRQYTAWHDGYDSGDVTCNPAMLVNDVYDTDASNEWIPPTTATIAPSNTSSEIGSADEIVAHKPKRKSRRKGTANRARLRRLKRAKRNRGDLIRTQPSSTPQPRKKRRTHSVFESIDIVSRNDTIRPPIRTAPRTKVSAPQPILSLPDLNMPMPKTSVKKSSKQEMDYEFENEQKHTHTPIPGAPKRAKRKFYPPPPANCGKFASFRKLPSPPRYVRPKHDYI